MTDNFGASPVCHQCLQALLYIGLTCVSLGLCTWVQMHPWLQLVDDGAELRSPLTLHLYLTHCVVLMDPKFQGREFHVCTLPEYQVMPKKKRPKMLSTGRDGGAHLNPARGEPHSLYPHVNFTCLPGAHRCSLLLLVHLGCEQRPVRVV